MRCRAVAVVVPARDEVARVAACLQSLLVAVDRCPVPARIVVVDDASTDGTGAVARGLLGRPHQVVVGPGTDVGSARRVGVDHVASRTPFDALSSTWVASTDADTTVPPDWLERHVVHARAGADAVAGVVRLDGGAPPALRAAFRRRYGERSSGRHPHLHAANLGIRLSTLQAAGSWRSRGHAEEHDLWARLPDGTRVVADAGLVVTTSARRRGRVPIGFADDLERLHASLSGAADDVGRDRGPATPGRPVLSQRSTA